LPNLSTNLTVLSYKLNQKEMEKSKLLLIIALSIGFAASLSAQTTSRWSFDAVYGLEKVTINNTHTDRSATKTLWQDAANYGINLNYRINEHYLLKTGVQYSILGNTTGSNFDFGTPIFDVPNFEANNIAQVNAQKFRELAIPFALRYYYKLTPLKLYVEGGNTFIKKYDGNMRLDLSLGLGLEVQFYNRMSIFVQPNYRFALDNNPASGNIDKKIHRHSVGLQLGLRYN
jgi:Outer membrane protein beta-barrel domain